MTEHELHELIRKDNDRIAKGELPNFVVQSNKIGTPFVDALLAIKWHNYLYNQGIPTVITDLTDYDWIKNEKGFKVGTLNDLDKELENKKTIVH